jgi:hypothetical protein
LQRGRRKSDRKTRRCARPSISGNVNVIGSVPMLSGAESLRVGAMEDDASEERITLIVLNLCSAALELSSHE